MCDVSILFRTPPIIEITNAKTPNAGLEVYKMLIF